MRSWLSTIVCACLFTLHEIRIGYWCVISIMWCFRLGTETSYIPYLQSDTLFLLIWRDKRKPWCFRLGTETSRMRCLVSLTLVLTEEWNTRKYRCFRLGTETSHIRPGPFDQIVLRTRDYWVCGYNILPNLLLVRAINNDDTCSLAVLEPSPLSNNNLWVRPC